ncbi:Fumarylacetoacetase, C-terminal-like protein [Penicillium expansum]|uniref:Fumarylacetoacetase, C-terminal-like protein n=1 Tax=Penicillium expansum TaxID=27334 RepID=A0A0A2KA67_PENEN|nr:Fumarylacetoacetase, C-terminal-like protein [Penicillium expansum]KGO36421.1 Fumarylacetoacetase, C-terminal-like protein [Penicillium expansum]KGO50919.1 Fumarylacetoacetase, C-terminal-like protein [Penicillium expansum]KGO63786.1 Fumarylacetoacetase, C-terminal-like protein [Penicillium expansum]
MGISNVNGTEFKDTLAARHPVWKRWVRFRAEDGRIYGGEPVNLDIDVGQAIEKNIEVSVKVVAVSQIEAGTVRCIGLNYKEHAAEMKLTLPNTPTVFLKASTCIASASEPIILPSNVDYDEADYEVELAIVIGRQCKNVSVAEAADYVLGYAVANDVTARKHQEKTSQWSYAKGMDGFCPLGPCIVSTEQIPNPAVLNLKTRLNGKIMQSGAADDMIFSIPEIVSYLSQGHTLLPGTVIITGTPCGIGISQSPPQFLQPGDELRISISHGLGTQICPIVRD